MGPVIVSFVFYRVAEIDWFLSDVSNDRFLTISPRVLHKTTWLGKLRR